MPIIQRQDSVEQAALVKIANSLVETISFIQKKWYKQYSRWRDKWGTQRLTWQESQSQRWCCTITTMTSLQLLLLFFLLLLLSCCTHYCKIVDSKYDCCTLGFCYNINININMNIVINLFHAASTLISCNNTDCGLRVVLGVWKRSIQPFWLSASCERKIKWPQ